MREHIGSMAQNYEVGRSTFTVFGALSAVVALIGLGGVLAYLVAQERTAFALRLALGAPTSQLVQPVLMRAVTLVGAGLAISIAILAMFRERVNEALFHTDILNPLLIGPVVVAGLLLALAAAWIPLRTVIRLQPMQVLREE
jgi:ABC-type antimicrobial peptide transport system permease subunit